MSTGTSQVKRSWEASASSASSSSSCSSPRRRKRTRAQSSAQASAQSTPKPFAAAPPPRPSCPQRPRTDKEGEAGGVHNFTCRPCQNGQGEGSARLFPAERRRLRSLRCGPGSTRLPGRTPGGGCEPPPPLSSPPSVPEGRRASQAPHHGCDAGPRRAP